MFLAGGFSRLGLNADAAGNTSAASSYGIAAASMIFIFTSTFGATWLTVPWLYPAEIFPLAVRAKGNAWGVVGWSIGNGWLVSGISMELSSSSLAADLSSTYVSAMSHRPFSYPSASSTSEKRPTTSLALPTS
jgi:hypothetical protein